LQASFFTLGFGFLSLLDLLPCTWYLEALLASVLGLISCLRATHPSLTLCNVHLTCDVHYVSIIQFLDHHICSLVLNLVDFTLSTCSTLSTLVSPLIELSSKHQNSQESFQCCNVQLYYLADKPGVHFVCQPDQESSGLAMSRAFDNYYIKDCGVISAPEVTQRRIDSNDQFAILATIWVAFVSAYV
jgi:hypothetical protein